MIKRCRFDVNASQIYTHSEISVEIEKEIKSHINSNEELKYAYENNDILNIIEKGNNNDYYEIVVYYKVKDNLCVK